MPVNKREEGHDTATLVDMLPRDEGRVVAEVATTGKARRSYSYSNDPSYELRPSRSNPKVRRWMKKTQLMHTIHEGGEGLVDVDPELGSNPAFSHAVTLAAEISAKTKHRKVLKEWEKVDFTLEDGPAKGRTPLYYPDTHEIKLHQEHLRPEYWRRFGVNGPGIVLAHELAHAWDFSRGAVEGHPQKSYWMSKVVPSLLEGTKGRVPNWVGSVPELSRMRYAAMEVGEMPAVLTEYALSNPEAYKAVTQWFSENTGFDLGEAMTEFWGADLLDGVYTDESKVNELLGKMERAHRRRSFIPWARRRWRSRIAKQASYAGADHEQDRFDPGFIPIQVLVKNSDFKPLIFKKGRKEENGESDD